LRGLTDAGPTRARTFQAVIAAVAVLAAVALSVTACGTGGTGARDEGPAHADSVVSPAGAATPSAPSPTPVPKVDPVRLVKDDPQVSVAVKRDLEPCVGDEYPVDVSYGNLTGGSVDDIVVNVLTCGDAVGVGSYVYRGQGGGYENVFKAEESPVYAEIDRGDLTVTKQVYEKGDPVSNPSGETVTTYSWVAGRFVERDTHRTRYSNAVGSAAAGPAEDN
jgi:hypothetical protein